MRGLEAQAVQASNRGVSCAFTVCTTHAKLMHLGAYTAALLEMATVGPWDTSSPLPWTAR